MHNFIWVSNTISKFRKKLIIQFQENEDKQKEGWEDGDLRYRPYFIIALRLPSWVQ